MSNGAFVTSLNLFNIFSGSSLVKVIRAYPFNEFLMDDI